MRGLPSFWHIPWPNPEAFGICPWQRELLDGLLGADLIGFHIQAHCNNFLKYRGSRTGIARRLGALFRQAPRPLVYGAVHSRSAWTFGGDPTPPARINAEDERSALIAELGIEADYPRCRRGSRGLYQGNYRAFPGRRVISGKTSPLSGQVHIYPDWRAQPQQHPTLCRFSEEVEVEADRINDRFRRGKWRPIVFLNRQHTHQEVRRYYRAAHVCMVDVFP